MDHLYDQFHGQFYPVVPVPRRRKATAGGKRARAHLGCPVAVPRVVPRLSRGLPRGLSRGGPLGCPRGCPAVVLRVSRGSLYAHAVI